MKSNKNVELAHLVRGGHLDNIHAGSVLAADNRGRIIFCAGDPSKTAFLRSGAKPMQALAALERGASARFKLTDAECAIMCGSHCGGPEQVRTVRRILKKAGFKESDLICGAGIKDNCSGKHAGMLLLAKMLNVSPQDYFKPKHPVQKCLAATIGAMCDIPPGKLQSAVDGCGVPIFYMPLRNMAMAFARMAAPGNLPPDRAAACRHIVSCMQAHPAMTGEPDFFSICKPVFFSKAGANGVYCAGMPERGIGIAFKIDDGTAVARNAVLLQVLRNLKITGVGEHARLMKKFVPPITNRCGTPVGQIITVF